MVVELNITSLYVHYTVASSGNREISQRAARARVSVYIRMEHGVFPSY